jgi:hypothetical protein
MSMNRELWLEYRKTSKEFARKLKEVQELADSGKTGEEADRSLAELKHARLAHNTARDRLAQHLSALKLEQNPQGAREQRVRRTARLIWEFSGKPQNSAESDWNRAEQLASSASA